MWYWNTLRPDSQTLRPVELSWEPRDISSCIWPFYFDKEIWSEAKKISKKWCWDKWSDAFKYIFSGTEEILQHVKCMFCTKVTWTWFLASHMFPWSLPGMICQYRARSKWTLSTTRYGTQTEKNKTKLMNLETYLLQCKRQMSLLLKWIPFFKIGMTNTVNMTILPKVLYNFNSVHIKMPMKI